VVDAHHSRHDPLGHIGAGQHHPSLVVDADHIAVLDAPGGGIPGVHPQRLILVAVGGPDLTRFDLPQPGHVVVLGVHPPARVVAHDQQRVLLAPLRAEGLLV